MKVPHQVFLRHPETRLFKKEDMNKCTNAIVTLPGSKDTFSLQGKITRKSQQSITVSGLVSKRMVHMNVPINSPVIYVKLLKDIGTFYFRLLTLYR